MGMAHDAVETIVAKLREAEALLAREQTLAEASGKRWIGGAT